MKPYNNPGSTGFRSLISGTIRAVLFRGSQTGAWIGGFLLVVLTGITFVTVVGRHSPFAGPWLTGGYEISELLMGILAVSAWAYCWYRGGHIRIDLIRAHSGKKGKLIIDKISSFLGFMFIGFASWAMIETTMVSFNWDVGTPLVKVPIGPFQIVMAVLLIHFAAVLSWSVFEIVGKESGHEQDIK